MAIRDLAAWQRGDKFYLSAFVGEKTYGEVREPSLPGKRGKLLVPGRTPMREFDSREALEAEVHRRNGRLPGTQVDARKSVNLIWEYLEPEGDA